MSIREEEGVVKKGRSSKAKTKTPVKNSSIIENSTVDNLTGIENEQGENQATGNDANEEQEEKVTVLPILPLRGLVFYPYLVAPLNIGRERSVRLVNDVMVGEKFIGLVAQKDPVEDEPEPDGLFSVGTAAKILKMVKLPNGDLSCLVQGLYRFRVNKYIQIKPYFLAEVEDIETGVLEDSEVEAISYNIRNLFKKIMELSPSIPRELEVVAMNIEEPVHLGDFVVSNLSIAIEEKQKILEMLDVKKRLMEILYHINRELQKLEISRKIQTQITDEVNKQQKDLFLREQLRTIKKELGEKDEKSLEIDELTAKIKNAKMSKEAEKAAYKELDRLAIMPPQAAEYSVIRTYFDWLIELPWSVETSDNLDIKAAEKILDEDHYDLEKIKTRILEYLAVRKLKQDKKGPILCFVGPPGVGKTSLGRSIARALGRKFYRLSLGGVRDEAEIRGHRRTYIGALPGRIIQGLRKASSNNPVFMLDEVDKIGMDFRGDPSSALLEVLDPEQNFAFSDHYLEVSFDLSKVFFITTANIITTIPPALKDRMEVLELPGYIEEEKILIAKKFLIPKQLDEHALTRKNLQIKTQSLKRIIRDYTREAGVRNLEREIATICRRVARKVAEGDETPVSIYSKDLETHLGQPQFYSDIAERITTPGIATGLAWTPVGGDILFVEATSMQGKQGLILTGHLGDVMKESAQTGLSYVRSKAKEYGIKDDFYVNMDLHLHVPSGAIPKDGPSAGAAMVVALVSLLTDRLVPSDLAMTGEITLRGKLLPVGGIKAKVLAAHRAGIRRIVLPKRNIKDLEEVPAQVKADMSFEFVETIDQLLKFVFDSLKKNSKMDSNAGC